MSTNDLQEWRIQRLIAASDKAGGDAELGRMLGHQSGAQVGHMRYGRRPVTEKTIQKIESARGYEGWFSTTSPSTETVATTTVAQALDVLADTLETLPEAARLEIAPLLQALTLAPDSKRLRSSLLTVLMRRV